MVIVINFFNSNYKLFSLKIYFKIIYSSEKPTARRIKRIIDASQYQIDAGQKKFGGFLCKQCGLYYSRGEPEDEAEHDKYHAAKNIFKYNVC